MEIRIHLLNSSAKTPTRATYGSACWDIYASEDAVVSPLQVTRVKTGFALEIPKGYMVDVRPRSGLSCEGVLIANTPGTIDSDYRGEVMVPMFGLGCSHNVLKGDRIAQMRLVPIVPIKFAQVTELSGTIRGEGGFGSSGR